MNVAYLYRRKCNEWVIAMVLFVLTLSSCRTQRSREADQSDGDMAVFLTANSIVQEAKAAGDALRKMHNDGALPDYSANEHGEIESDPLTVGDNDRVRYPLTNTFHVTKNGYDVVYNYMVVKPSASAGWVLTRAWQTAPNGNVLQEWPVK